MRIHDLNAQIQVYQKEKTIVLNKKLQFLHHNLYTEKQTKARKFVNNWSHETVLSRRWQGAFKI